MRVPQSFEYFDFAVQVLPELLVESAKLDRLDGNEGIGCL